MRKKNTIKIDVANLKPGMFVVDVGRSWLNHPWPTKRKMITSTKDIQQLVDFGIEQVLIDPDLGNHSSKEDQEFGITEQDARNAEAIQPEQMIDSEESEPIEQVERRKTVRPEKPVDNVSQEEELPRARQVYQKAMNVTRELINDARAGKALQIKLVQESVEDIIDSIFRSRRAMAALLKLKSYDEYTFTHSINVTALAVTLGRHLDLSRENLSTLGLGAMLHDVGKSMVPEEILNKPGKLTEEQFEIMKKHSEWGAEFLEKNYHNLPDEVLKIVRHHHERMDGSGYPSGLRLGQINDYMTICGICDVYDALSSDRVYHQKMPPHEALKIVFSLRGKYFPESWIDRFVQCMGIYPVGTAVQLNTGDIAVITRVNFEALLKPVVRPVLDPKGQKRNMKKDINLAEPRYRDIEVVKVVDAADFGIDLSTFFSGSP